MNLSLIKKNWRKTEGIHYVPTTKWMFRTGFQEQCFKLVPKGLKYLRLIIPIKLKAPPVPRTDHSKLFYIPSTLLPAGLDYLGQQIVSYSWEAGNSTNPRRKWRFSSMSYTKSRHSLCYASSVHCINIAAFRIIKSRAHNIALQANQAESSHSHRSRTAVQGLYFPVQLLRKTTLTLPSHIEQIESY